MEDKRNYWGFAVLICWILLSFLGGVDVALFIVYHGLVFAAKIAYVSLGITTVVSAVIAISTRGYQAMDATQKERSRPWVCAAFICYIGCVLLFVLPLILEAFRSLRFAGSVISALLSLFAISLAIVTVALAIIGVKKRQLGGKTLAIFVCCILPYVLIFAGSTVYLPFLLSPPAIVSRVRSLFIAPLFGLIVVVLAIDGIRKHEFTGRTIAMAAIVPAIFEMMWGLFLVKVLNGPLW
ncbi:MAG: hypothetical protein ACYS30_22315 [Planctomycetota bacterium]|jgi:hypothetical protein